MRIISVLLCCLYLSACDSTSSLASALSVYTINNAKAESLLKRQIPNLSQELKIMGLPVEFDVSKLGVDIGPDDRDVVQLDMQANAELKLLMISYPASVMLKVEGAPFYDSEQKAVFVRNVKLLDSSIDAGGYKGNLGLLNTQAMNILNAFLATTPVYRLDTSDPKIALLSKAPLDIKVSKGKITLVPKLN